jgi:hypothetical protein
MSLSAAGMKDEEADDFFHPTTDARCTKNGKCLLPGAQPPSSSFTMHGM